MFPERFFSRWYFTARYWLKRGRFSGLPPAARRIVLRREDRTATIPAGAPRVLRIPPEPK